VMHNGTGSGGMYVTPEPGAEHRDRFPLAQGEEHGPYFAFDGSTGVPRLRDNGAVEYPWHGWQGGIDDRPGQAYDVVAAFEITAPYARVTTAGGR
jgi:Aldos-2-ulose dehydratase/isomerase (AUDH) Cupin domain